MSNWREKPRRRQRKCAKSRGFGGAVQLKLTCAAVLLASGVGTLGCVPIADEQQFDGRSKRAVRSESADLAAPYAPGRWRLLTPDELDSVVVWLSHILIRHRDAAPDDLGFRALDWTSGEPRASRSREEAQQLATKIASALRAHPNAFAQYVSEYSEDVASRDRDGALCGVRASRFPPQILDAVQALPIGEISRVVETQYGFHLLTRARPPEPQLVAAQRILLRYQGTSMGDVHGAVRTRKDALALAHQIRLSAGAFEELVHTYSEALDRIRGGDIGIWSIVRPSNNGCELQTVAALGMHEVSGPVDTPEGIVLLKRSTLTARQEFAANTIKLYYDPLAASGERSRLAVSQLADSLHSRVRSNPAAFRGLQEQHCCVGPSVWHLGRGEPLLESTVLGLSDGEIASQPIDDHAAFVIVQRIPLADAPRTNEPPMLYELPSPTTVDASGYVAGSDGSKLAESVRRLREHARGVLRLSEVESSRFNSILSELEREFARAATPEQRLQARQAALFSVSSEFDFDAQAQIRGMLDSWVASEVMQLR